MFPSGRRPRIVVVDDDRSVLWIVHRLLERLGWEAHRAESAVDALSMLHHLGPVEAVLTDVNMPAMDGVSLCHEVINRFPGTAVVLMSGGEVTHAASLTSAIGLRKPFTMQALAAALDAACRDRT